MIYFICLLLLAYSAFITFHAYRWAKIIFSLEDEYSKALEVLQRTNLLFDNIMNMQMFFDSPSVKKVVEEVKEDVSLSRTAINGIIIKLTEHSKKKYIVEEE